MPTEQVEQGGLVLLHRPHRVGEDDHVEATRQRVVDHLDQIRIHERLAAGETDELGRERAIADLVEIASGFGRGQVLETIVLR